MAEDLKDKIKENAEDPKCARGDSGEVEQYDLADQIAADPDIIEDVKDRLEGMGHTCDTVACRQTRGRYGHSLFHSPRLVSIVGAHCPRLMSGYNRVAFESYAPHTPADAWHQWVDPGREGNTVIRRVLADAGLDFSEVIRSQIVSPQEVAGRLVRPPAESR